ncbi:phosphate signaling complex protein PhoU [Paracoccus sp. p4-l81]|uniref:phosphate signaling complex protein PhoU n=1 Tax=Paracoccus sp. p4-l81 TaxID=3342806 RepID=UPI0035B80704
MMPGHIQNAFDRDLSELRGELRQMGALVGTAMHDAAHGLETRDVALARQVRTGDRAIDALEDRINTETARIIALRQPAASDMRLVLSVVKAAASLERIGDYAKNMAKRTEALVQVDPVGSTAGTLRRMSAVVEKMLADALTAYLDRDADLADQVRAADAEVDQIYSSLFRTLLTHMMEDPRCISAAMHLHFIAKNIERMGDHVTAIAEEAIYLVRGERPDDERVKSDTTAGVIVQSGD